MSINVNKPYRKWCDMKKTVHGLSSNRLIWVGILIAGMIMIIIALFLQANEQEKQRYQSIAELLDEKIQSNFDEIQKVENLSQPVIDQQVEKVENATQQQFIEEEVVGNDVLQSIPEVEALTTEQATSGGSSQTTGQAQDNKININTATAEQLQSLKGIGPSKAAAIIADREKLGAFQSIDEIKRVKGIGEKLYAGIKESIVAEP